MRLKVSLVLTVTVLIFTSLLSNVYAASTLQIMVNESGQGNTVLTYTGGDFDIPYDSYQTVGDSLFKAAIVYAASQLGFSVLISSIMIDISQSTKTMTITATITNIAQQIDATTWRINATLAKTVYTSWNQSGTTFTFTAPTKPQLPFPQTFNLQLPPNAVNIQFNPDTYILTYQLSTPTPTPTPAPRSGCVIATATFGSPMAPEVVYMRNVRDDMIGSNDVGKAIVIGWNSFYYSWSPPIAQFIDSHDTTKPIFRVLLLPLVGTVRLTAIIYGTISIVNTSIASMVAFSFAAFSSVAIYVVCPMITIRLIYRKTNSIH